ncbi:MAG: cytidine deaminase [Vampirovibrionales bacterium]|nr:cytidine deaminase [Vampirovibrionales bacterium]
MAEPLEKAALTPLLSEAQRVSSHAYAPYSHFLVGAAIQTTDGQIITGVNVENASYGLTHCAERTALFTAIAQGYAGKLKAIAIWANDVKQQYGQRFEGAATPCGACRQVMAELLPPDAEVQFVHPQTGAITHTTPSELLPLSFTL